MAAFAAASLLAPLGSPCLFYVFIDWANANVSLKETNTGAYATGKAGALKTVAEGFFPAIF